MKGFFNRVLIIDVTRKTTREDPVADDILKQYLGGKGLATHLLLEHNPTGVDPLSPESHLIVGLGPLTDSPIYGSCRYGIFGKSPLTGFYAESYSGGRAAPAISGAGYDAVVIRGAADAPVWLEISDTGVVFHDAKDLWGKDTYDTEDAVKALCGRKDAAALVIGPAGENLVKYAVIENDYWRSAGRTGMGAVMGSKNIKALVFHGEKRRSFHDPDAMKQYAKTMAKDLNQHPATRTYRTQGTPVMVDGLNRAGAFPARYWSQGTCDHYEQINAAAMAEKLGAKPRSCKTCFMGCGKLVEVKQGRHAGLKLEGPEYETIYAFGGLCMIDSIEEITWLNDICDRLGLDTITAGNLAALAIEASSRGKISETLAYGDADAVADLLEKIARREGIGGLLADGIKTAAPEMGMADLAVHVKGMEPAGYDPRILKGMGLAYAVSPRGACHLRSTFYKPELAGMIDPEQIEGKAQMFIDFEDRCTLFDTLILCRFYRDFYPWEELAALINMATGMDLSKEELAKTASQVTNLTRRFNLQEGLTRADDFLPKRLLTEKLPDGNGITEPELTRLIDDYYRLRGWDRNGRIF
ncbi:MAG: aldehyde ferredoxin oxidoreductase family protein [Thermodesulfobacteriota bacterium]